jgi:uridine kinase
MNELPEKKWVSYHKIHKENNNLSFDERALINFDHPRAIDFDLLVAHLKELKAEKQFTNLFIL